MDYQYQFTHKATGRKVISQSWAEYCNLDSNEEYIDPVFHARLDPPRCNNYQHNSYMADCASKLNAFWAGALGYEKVSKIECNGYPASGLFNGIRLFLKNTRNHACMIGDIETVKKTMESDKYFHHNSGVTRLCLPAPR